jgi:hypothetical protein
MDTGAVGRADAAHRSRTSRWVTVALTGAVALGLVAAVGLGGARHPAPDPGTAATDSTLVLGYDDASAAELGAKPHLRLTVKVLGKPIYPGARRTVKVAIANPFGFAVRVVQVKATTRSTTVAGCRPRWFRSTAFSTKKLRKGVLVKAHRKGTKKLTIRMVDLPTVNQDACKSARYTLSLRAVARRA